MPLTNQDLLTGITEAINSALDTTLRASLDALQADFDALRASNVELMERNDKLINLNKALIERRDLVPPGVAGSATNVPATIISCVPPPANLPDKEFVDILLISDSIYRHVGVACPRDARPRYRNRPVVADFWVGNTHVKKLCLPGAKAERLLAEASIMALTHEFREVVVHVGANYLPTVSRDHPTTRAAASVEIQALLAALGDIFYAPVTYSLMLPLASSRFTDAINSINEEVMSAGFHHINHTAFVRDDRGQIDRSLYCADGVHMNKNGIDALLNDLVEHIKWSRMYEEDVDDVDDIE